MLPALGSPAWQAEGRGRVTPDGFGAFLGVFYLCHFRGPGQEGGKAPLSVLNVLMVRILIITL